MKSYKKQEFQRKNIAEIKNTPSYLLRSSGLISRMENMNFNLIKEEFENILRKAKALDSKKRIYYLNCCSQKKTKLELMIFISNFLLAGEKLSSNIENYSHR